MLDVDDPDSAQFHVVPENVRGLSHERAVRILADVDDVVGDQAVPALDEIERRLALSDTGFAEEQDSHPVDVDENAVERGRRRELVFQDPRDRLDHHRRRLGRDEERDAARAALPDELLRDLLALGHDERRDGQRADHADALAAQVERHRVEVIELALAEHLDPARLDEREKTREREAGPLDPAPGDRPIEAGLPRDDAHLEVGEAGRSKDVGGQLGHALSHSGAF
jgi:hypothetical protein